MKLLRITAILALVTVCVPVLAQDEDPTPDPCDPLPYIENAPAYPINPNAEDFRIPPHSAFLPDYSEPRPVPQIPQPTYDYSARNVSPYGEGPYGVLDPKDYDSVLLERRIERDLESRFYCPPPPAIGFDAPEILLRSIRGW